MNNFTIKAQEALARAQREAAERHHQTLDVLHLFLALLSQDDGVVVPVLKKLEVSVARLKEKAEELLKAIPAVSGGGLAQLYLSDDLRRVFDAGQQHASQLKDEYISTEHFLLALAEVRSSAQELLEAEGVTAQRLLQVLKDVRGNQRITDQDPESKYQAL